MKRPAESRWALFMSWLCAALLSATLAPPAMAQFAPALPELIEMNADELATPTGQQLTASLDAYRDSLGEDDTQALEAAKQVVALSVELWGDADLRVAQALTNLAIAQGNIGEHSAARGNFVSAIRISEVATNSIVEPILTNPLRGLATSHLALNNKDLAIEVFERAIHVLHVNDGPYNLDQLPILEALSRVYFFRNKISDANDIQDNIFWLQKRKYTEDSDQFVDAQLRRARWYARTDNFYEATLLFRRVERTLSENYGPDDVRLVEPLLELGFVAPRQANNTTSLTYTGVQEGRRAIARAARIARLHAEARPELLLRTLTRQADSLMIAGRTRNARMTYREAWELVQADSGLADLHEALYGKPVAVIRPDIERVFDHQGNALGVDEKIYRDTGYVDVRFDVNEFGKPFNIRRINSEPAGLMDTHVTRSLRRFVFRPAYRDGELVEYHDMNFRHEFRYDAGALSDRSKAFVKLTRAEIDAALAEAAAEQGATDQNNQGDIATPDVSSNNSKLPSDTSSESTRQLQ